MITVRLVRGSLWISTVISRGIVRRHGKSVP